MGQSAAHAHVLALPRAHAGSATRGSQPCVIIVAMRFAIVAALLVACGGSPAPSASSPSNQNEQPTLVDPVPGTARVVDCATAVDHVLTKMTPGGVPIQAHVNLDVQRCNEDGWSDGARSCMATAMSRDQGQGCFDRDLTNEQRKKLGEATLAAFGDHK